MAISRNFHLLATAAAMLAIAPATPAEKSVEPVGLTIVLTSVPKDTKGPIYVAGTFNHWHTADSDLKLKPGPDGRYRITLPMAVHGRVEFKLTQGLWLNVEQDASGHDTPNRIVTLTETGSSTYEGAVETWRHPTVEELQTYQTCRSDLEWLPAFLLENDSGARAEATAKGEELFASAFADTESYVSSVKTADECLDVLNGYLRTYRVGHLRIDSVVQEPEDQRGNGPPEPSFRILSTKTALIAVPSFETAFKGKVAKLVKDHRAEILKHPNLIIDVRGNGGGSDYVYSPLLPFIRANRVHQFGVEFLATLENVKATDTVAKEVAATCPECAASITTIAKRMQDAPAGTFVSAGPDQDYDPSDVTRNPQRVAILIDRRCGSSCEQFALDARRHFKVKLFGRPTFGSLDYSNLRPTDLPSGKRRIWRATSRSRRLPELPIDGIGVQPDQLLKRPANSAEFDAEVDKVKAILESR
jgi:peptidase S41-like protein